MSSSAIAAASISLSSTDASLIADCVIFCLGVGGAAVTIALRGSAAVSGSDCGTSVASAAAPHVGTSSPARRV